MCPSSSHLLRADHIMTPSDRRACPMDVLDRRAFLTGGAAVLGSTLLPSSRLRANTAGEFDFASAVTLARAIRARDVSSVEVTNRMLDRIQRFNPKLNAIITLAADMALARARASDEALARGELWGHFHGVPCTIKDTLETAGVRTTAGAPFLAKHVPTRDATVVERLRGAGAVMLGKTNVPFMAADWQSFNDVFGMTSNPWDLSRTPGGSSGGEAAALAAGLTYLSVGSDLAGSIRVPAHFCGIYGHKPTLGIVPRAGHIPPPPGGPPPPPSPLGGMGPLARSAGDLRAVLEVIAGPPDDETIAYRWSLPPARGSRLADYRIGFVLDDRACPVAPDVGDVLATAIEALRKAGAHIEEGWPKGVAPAEQFDTFSFLVAALFRAPSIRADQMEELRKLAARQDGSLAAKDAVAVTTASLQQFQTAMLKRMAARAAWNDYFRVHDVFLMPTAFVTAFPHDRSMPQDLRRIATANGPREYAELRFWISFASLTGLPATTAPVGLTRGGLPVGIQIIGPYLEDATPIDVAARLADLVGGFRAPKAYEP
jgi:amidase